MSIEDLSGFFLMVETKSKFMTSDSPSFNHIDKLYIGLEENLKKKFYNSQLGRFILAKGNPYPKPIFYAQKLSNYPCI